MGVISWAVFGLIAGILAKWLFGKNSSGGFIMTIILGIVGAMVGGYISTFLGFGTVTGFNVGSFFIAVVGALLVLFVFNRLSK